MSASPRMIFVNLPCRDIEASRAFYAGLGYSFNPQFSDEETTCVVLSDTIYFMIMSHSKFAGFSPRPIADTTAVTSTLIALTADNRIDVDTFADRVLAHGGTDNGKTMDYGFMYSRSFSDPDGHVLEVVWMDMEAAAMAAEAPAG